MTILDRLRKVFSRDRGNTIIKDPYTISNLDLMIGHYEFGNVIFYNVMDILVDLVNDVELKRDSKLTNALDFANFKTFFEQDSKDVLYRYFNFGYVVIQLPSETNRAYRILEKETDYTIQTNESGAWKVVPFNLKDNEIYVMKSNLFLNTGLSHKMFLYPYIKYINSLLDASNTITSRLGSVIVCSPKNLSSAPTDIVLTDEDKKEIEKDLSEKYGALHNQRQIMILPREMNFENLSLTALDDKLETKLKLAIEVICDTFKVPSNQLAVIDASSSKALSNGSELIAGDVRKYMSFERLLNETFIKMADDLRINLTYEIYNKPNPNSANLEENVE